MSLPEERNQLARIIRKAHVVGRFIGVCTPETRMEATTKLYYCSLPVQLITRPVHSKHKQNCEVTYRGVPDGHAPGPAHPPPSTHQRS